MDNILSSLYQLGGILEIIFVIFSGLVAYIMNNLSSRIAELEVHREKLAQEKLDKEEYHRDQDKIDGTLKDMRDEIRNLPEKILNLFTRMGK